jgi:hypothetical protein
MKCQTCDQEANQRIEWEGPGGRMLLVTCPNCARDWRRLWSTHPGVDSAVVTLLKPILTGEGEPWNAVC